MKTTLRCGLLAAGLMGAVGIANPAQALVINPFFASGITSASNAGDIQAAINLAASTIGSLYANPGTINIVFNLGAVSLGQSQTGIYSMSYASYTGLLTADSVANPGNTVLASAVANLPVGNGATGVVPIRAASALLRVGLSASGITPCYNSAGVFVSGCSQFYDGVVTLSNTAPIDFTRPVGAGRYDGLSVISHEINEVLGGGGPGSSLNSYAATCSPITPTAFGPLDLYRFSAPGTPSFTTCSSATSYLSVNGGTTSVVAFNQNPAGDLADFGTTGLIQSAYGSLGVQPANYTTLSPEYTMMTSLGYNPVRSVASVPEPASMALLGIGLTGLTLFRRRNAS